MYYTKWKSLWLIVHKTGEDEISRSSCLAILAEELNMCQFGTQYLFSGYLHVNKYKRIC